MTATMTDTPRRAKKLYRDPSDKMIAGVASGVAEYFDVDTTLVRVLWASSIVFGGFGLVAYVLLWLILDEEPATDTMIADARPVGAEREPSAEPSFDTEAPATEASPAVEPTTETPDV